MKAGPPWMQIHGGPLRAYCSAFSAIAEAVQHPVPRLHADGSAEIIHPTFTLAYPRFHADTDIHSHQTGGNAMTMLRAKIMGYLLPAIANSLQDRRRARLLVNVLIILSLFSLVYLLICYIAGIIIGVYSNLIMFPCCIAALFVFKKTSLFVSSINIAIFGFIAGITEGALFSGGIRSPALPWLIAGPTLAFLLGNKTAGITWTVIASVIILFIGCINMFEIQVPYLFPDTIKYYILTFTFIAVTVFFAIVIITYDNTRTEMTNALALEKEKSENLLLNILPEAVALELKENKKYEAKQYANISVLFTDFVGFTKISEQLTAKELVEEIDACFKAFDGIIENNHMEKIKTIGDSYLAAAGVPEDRPAHARDAVNAAIEICGFMEQRKIERAATGEIPFEIRIGIHSGPVIAGIVGIKKFAYDIWGDTVNIASRMESSGEPGKINISESTHELVKELYKCTYRGKIAAKGKGELDMYFVDPAM